MRGERRLDLGLLKGLRGSTPLDSLQAPQLGQRDDSGSLAAEMDHFVGQFAVGCALIGPP